MAAKTQKTIKKGGWPTVARIIKGQNGSYLQFLEGVEITLNGEKVVMNDKRTAILQDPLAEVNRMIENGVIKEDKAESRLAQATEASSWLKYSVVVPPPKDT